MQTNCFVSCHCQSFSTCPREGLVGWEGLDSVIGGSRRGRDDRGRGRGGPGRGRDGRGRRSGGRGPASGGQEQGHPQDFDRGVPPGRYSPTTLDSLWHHVLSQKCRSLSSCQMVLRLCNLERGRMQEAPAASTVAWHQWHSLWIGVLYSLAEGWICLIAV